MKYSAPIDKHHLSADKFIGRACTLLLILFCLIAIVGYINLPFNIPIHFTDGLPDKFSNKTQVFIIPAIGMSLYLLVSYFEKFTYTPTKKPGIKRTEAYYSSMAKLVGFLKLLILFSGIIVTAEYIHRSLNIGGEYDWECNALAALLILIPMIFMATEINNVKKALLTKQ